MAGLDKNVRELTIYLDPDEVIQATAFGAYETTILGGDSVRNGVLAATNKRLVLFAKKLTGYDMEVFPYSNISSLKMSEGLMGHHIKFFTSGNKSSVKWIRDKAAAQQLASLVKQRIDGGGEAVRDTQGPGNHNLFEDIEKLALLRDKGIITESEFEIKKQEILSPI